MSIIPDRFTEELVQERGFWLIEALAIILSPWKYLYGISFMIVQDTDYQILKKLLHDEYFLYQQTFYRDEITRA